jgi:hypothetical protein
MNGRHITWQNHALLATSELDDLAHLKATLAGPAIEVAMTKVVEGGVAGYYEQFRRVVVPILNADPGCNGHFISPLIENPQDQLLLINWESVDVSLVKVLSLSDSGNGCVERQGDLERKANFDRHIMKSLKRDRLLSSVLMLYLSTTRSLWCHGTLWS